MMNINDLPTWKACRLVVENYEYSTTKGVTGIESESPAPSPLETFIYENEPKSRMDAINFRKLVVDVLNLKDR